MKNRLEILKIYNTRNFMQKWGGFIKNITLIIKIAPNNNDFIYEVKRRKTLILKFFFYVKIYVND